MSQSKRLVIAYIPMSAENDYVNRFKSILGYFGDIQNPIGLKALVASRIQFRPKRMDVLIENWTDNYFINDRGDFDFASIIKIFVKTILLKMFVGRLIFVRHNRFPHSTNGRSRTRARKLINAYERCFDEVVVHSGAETDGFRHYCPHPLYSKSTNKSKPFELKFGAKNYFVIFGRLEKYKCIEKFLPKIGSNCNVVVAGGATDPEYLAELKKFESDNIQIIPRFLSNEESAGLVSESRALILCHAEENVIVSGSFFFALSNECPVIAISTPFLEWVNKKFARAIAVLAADVHQLASAVESFGDHSFNSDQLEQIKKEFGDVAIRHSLTMLLSPDRGFK